VKIPKNQNVERLDDLRSYYHPNEDRYLGGVLVTDDLPMIVANLNRMA